MRKLYSADHSCCSQCSYCFAKWKELYCRQPLFEKAELKEKEAIIYPCCDGEFFQQNQSVSALKQMAESMEKLYVSISTKNHMDQSMLKSICELNDFLVQNEKGFVKVAVSFAALSIDELEQGTLSYRERLELLAELSRLGLPTSVTLKPVLPFVSNEEYNDILKDCAKLVKRITIGGLYVNRNTAFFKKYIDGKYQTKPRRVSWLSGQPLWDYVCQEEKLLSIANSAVEKGLLVFESDEELIKSFVNSEGGSEHE